MLIAEGGFAHVLNAGIWIHAWMIISDVENRAGKTRSWKKAFSTTYMWGLDSARQRGMPAR